MTRSIEVETRDIGDSRSCCPEGHSVPLQREGGKWIIIAHGAEWII
jgi:hypothetical protein